MFGLHVFRELVFESLKVRPRYYCALRFEIFLVIHVYGFEECFRGFCIYMYIAVYSSLFTRLDLDHTITR